MMVRVRAILLVAALMVAFDRVVKLINGGV
jgi:hypothetical protein